MNIHVGKLPVDENGKPICPPPIEIDILKVKKVFQECMHTQVETVRERTWISATTRQATFCECVSAVATACNATIPSPGLVNVTSTITVTIRVPNDSGGFQTRTETVPVNRTFPLSRAGEAGLTAQCEIYPEFITPCAITERDATGGVNETTCCLGILILVKLTADVQLLIPTFGFAPQPPECGAIIGSCPTTFTPSWPPYPPQTDGNGGNNGGCGCH